MILRFTALSILFLLSAVSAAAQPILLLLPNDGDTLQSPNPAFNWTPLALVNSSYAEYTIRIVQVLPGQTPESAVLSNPAHFEATVSGITAFTYPLSATPFLQCSTYAWQVRSEYSTAEVEKLLVVSDVFHFTVSGSECLQSPQTQDSLSLIPPIASYAVIRSSVSRGYYHTVGKKFYFKFDNIYISDTLRFSIYNSSHERIDIPYSLVQKSGPNQYVLDLSNFGGFVDKSQYLFIVNHRGKTYQVKFEYRND